MTQIRRSSDGWRCATTCTRTSGGRASLPAPCSSGARSSPSRSTISPALPRYVCFLCRVQRDKHELLEDFAALDPREVIATDTAFAHNRANGNCGVWATRRASRSPRSSVHRIRRRDNRPSGDPVARRDLRSNADDDQCKRYKEGYARAAFACHAGLDRTEGSS